MKKASIILMAVAMLFTLFSCNKEKTSVPSDKKANIFVEIGFPETRATTGYSDAGEIKINNLQVLVFYADEDINGENRGKLEVYGGSLTNADASGVAVSCTQGRKTVYAVTNYDVDLSGIATISELLASGVTLAKQDFTNYTMVGVQTQDVSGGNNEVRVDLYRMAARGVVKKISNKFKVLAYQEAPFSIDKIYLTNVQGANNLGHTAYQGNEGVWYNKKKYEASEVSTKFMYDEVAANVAFDGSYTKDHYFYAFPNDFEGQNVWAGDSWSKRPTRLVIEASLNGEKVYYPISLMPFESNKSYEISEIIITKKGSDDPDKPVTSDDIQVYIQVKPWEVVPVNSAGKQGGIYEF